MRAKPIVDGLRQEWGTEVAVVQINIHDQANRDLIQVVEAQFTPTFVLYDRLGRDVWRSVGNLDPAEVRQQVARLD